MACSKNAPGQNLKETADERIAEFINHVHNEAKIKGTDAKIEEQREYVSDIVQLIFDYIKQIDPFMAVDEKCECGSFHDGTKILEPDEFDYIGKLACSDKIKIEEGCKEGYCHVRPIDPSLEYHIKNTIVKRVEKHTYKKYIVTDPSMEKYVNADLMGSYFYFSLFQEALEQLHKSIEARSTLYKYSEDLIDKVWEKHTGVKADGRYIAGFNSESGPNIMFKAHGPLCISSVDVTFAIKIDSEFMNKEKYGRLQNSDQCLLVPKPPDNAQYYTPPYATSKSTSCSYCWLMTSSSVEVQRVRASSKEHKKIHMMLKYMPREDQLDMIEMNKSYVSKTVMVKHNEKCPTTQGIQVPIARCFEDVLETMKDIHLIKLLDVPKGEELPFMVKLLISAFNVKRYIEEGDHWPKDWDLGRIEDIEDIFNELNKFIAKRAGVNLDTTDINKEFESLTEKIIAALQEHSNCCCITSQQSTVQNIKKCMENLNMELINKAIAFYCIHQGGAVLSHMHFPKTNVMYSKFDPTMVDFPSLDVDPHPSIFTHNDMKVLDAIVVKLKSPDGRQLMNEAKVSGSFLRYLKSKCDSGITAQCRAYEEVKAILNRL